MPEPEFFILLFVACAVFGMCSLIAGGLYFWGRRKNSKLFKVLAILTLVPGLIVFVPMFFLLLMWVWYWIFDDKTAGSSPQISPPAITNYVR
jgi:magnesium-transporting ATPase (P-type)